MRTLKTASHFFLVVLFVISSQISSKSADLISGTVRFQLPKSLYTCDRLYRFSFQIEGEKWIAKIEPIYCKSNNTNDLIIPDYEVAAYDGSTVYDLASFETDIKREIALTHAQDTSHITAAQATLFQEEFPWGVTPAIAHLWLVI